MALVERKYNRGVLDIERQFIQPRAKRLVEGAVQFFGHYCRKNHIWQNRTGALENSISWTEARKTARGWSARVEAGGFSKTRYAFDYGLRKATGQRRRNKIGGVTVPAGTAIIVNYARHVERKGYPVLKQGVKPTQKKFRILGVRIMKLPDSPRN